MESKRIQSNKEKSVTVCIFWSAMPEAAGGPASYTVLSKHHRRGNAIGVLRFINISAEC